MTNILVLDDDEDFAKTLVTWITQRTNWKADYALDVDNAAQKLRACAFDALLLDRNLSDVSGKPSRWGDELFLDLRSDAAFESLAVVFITGFGTQQNSAEMVRLGAFQYLTKPIPPEILIPTLTAAMAWQRAHSLCRALPASDMGPDDVMVKIKDIVAAVRPNHDNPPRLIQAGSVESEVHSAIVRELAGGRRSLLISGAAKLRRFMSANEKVQSLLAARVHGPDGGIASILIMESNDDKAFDPIWISVIESFADAMSLSYKLESLKRQIAEQAWKSLNEAAAEFRHAFNGRLHVMKTHAQRISSTDLTPLNTVSRERLLDSSEAINNTVDRLAAYVKRMTGFGDDLRMNPIDVDLSRLISECWRPLKDRARELNVEFSSVGPSVTLTADPMILEECLFCLLSNALDAIEDRRDSPGPDGKDEIQLLVESKVHAETRISVRDSGIGFDAGARDKLFLPFYTTKTDRPLRHVPSPHQGIGLFTVRRAMRLHGGDVTAESPGFQQGALFTLRLPKHV